MQQDKDVERATQRLSTIDRIDDVFGIGVQYLLGLLTAEREGPTDKKAQEYFDSAARKGCPLSKKYVQMHQVLRSADLSMPAGA
jgi:hypothetical protein